MAKWFAGVFGVVLTVAGIAGFFAPMEGRLDLTLAHNIVHIVTGLALLACSVTERTSAMASGVFGAVYVLLGFIGLFVHNLFGLIMLDRMDTAIHFAIGILALYARFVGGPAAVGTAKQRRTTNH